MTEIDSFLVDTFLNILREFAGRDPKVYVNVYVPVRAGIDLIRENYRGIAELTDEVFDLVLKYRLS